MKLFEVYCKSRRPMQQKCLEWFDIMVFYIKIVDACGLERAPDCLTVQYLPRNSLTALLVNGKQIHPSASAFVTLRRRAIDGEPSVWTYVSTDAVRTSGKLCFEVYVSHETLVCGALDRRTDSVNNDRQLTWTVECTCALEYPSNWSSTEKGFPSIEVCVAGREGSFPVMLTHSEELVAIKKRAREGLTLDAIPEGNDYENSVNSTDFDAIENQEGKGNFMELDDRSVAMILDGMMQKLSKLLELKEIKCLKYFGLSWLYMGLQLCIAVSLGFSLGLGIGVYLLVIRASRRTPQEKG